MFAIEFIMIQKKQKHSLPIKQKYREKKIHDMGVSTTKYLNLNKLYKVMLYLNNIFICYQGTFGLPNKKGKKDK